MEQVKASQELEIHANFSGTKASFDRLQMLVERTAEVIRKMIENRITINTDLLEKELDEAKTDIYSGYINADNINTRYLAAVTGSGRSILPSLALEYAYGVDLAKGPDYSVVNGEVIPNPNFVIENEMPITEARRHIMEMSRQIGRTGTIIDSLSVLNSIESDDPATVRKRNKSNMSEFLRGRGKRKGSRW